MPSDAITDSSAGLHCTALIDNQQLADRNVLAHSRDQPPVTPAGQALRVADIAGHRDLTSAGPYRRTIKTPDKVGTLHGNSVATVPSLATAPREIPAPMHQQPHLIFTSNYQLWNSCR